MGAKRKAWQARLEGCENDGGDTGILKRWTGVSFQSEIQKQDAFGFRTLQDACQV